MTDAPYDVTDDRHQRVVRLLTVVFFALFVLAGLGFSPFGFTRTEVFVTPKVQLWLASIVPLLLLLLLDVRRRSGRVAQAVATGQGRVPLAIVTALVAVIALLGVTAVHGTRPAWFGYPSIPEGALFFVALLAGFSLLWLVAQRYPPLERVVRVGVIVVASVASIAAAPQVIDWTLDYTVTSGQTVGDPPRHTLASVWRGQSPNAFFWHRGHLGIVACVGLLVAAGSMLQRSRASRLVSAASHLAIVLTCFGVLVSSTRTPQLAAVAGLALLWAAAALGWGSPTGRPLGWCRQGLAIIVRQGASVLAGVVLGLALLLAAGDARALSIFGLVAGQASAEEVFGGTSGRTQYWALTADAWASHPWLGRGFLAFHDVQAEHIVRQAVASGELSAEAAAGHRVTQGTVEVQLDDGSWWWRYLWGTKPHNALLELLLSVGVVGTVAMLGFYAVLIGAFVRRREVMGLAVLLAWFVYLAFWYESVQYSALVWALLAVVLARSNRTDITA